MGHNASKFTVNAVQAIKAGNDSKLRALLAEFKQFIDSQDQDGNTLLKIAVLNSQVNIVKTLLDEGADVNAPDSTGTICLHTAVDIGNKDVVRVLVERGSYLNGRNDNYETPLSVSVAKRNVEVVNILLNKHANVNITDSFGNSPLHVAVANGDIQICTLLLEKGKDIELNLQNVEGYTPLVLSLINNHEDIAALLCEHNCDGSVMGSDNIPPLLMAVQRKYLHVASALIKQGVDVNAADKSYLTPLVCALENKCGGLAKELLAAGASVDITPNKKSPLHLAAELGDKPLVDSILDLGVDVNLLDANEESPLVVAVKNQHEDVSRLLIERGANREDLYKALRIATTKSNKEIVKLVLSAMDTDQVVQFLMQVGGVLEDSGASKGADDDDRLCIVCFESSRDAVIVPCGHTGCCSNCLEGFPAPRLCPICRVQVQHVQKIYRV
jgi:ankyrin repeat protein